MKDSKLYLGSLLAPYYFEPANHTPLTQNDKAFAATQQSESSFLIGQLKNSDLISYIASKPKDLKQTNIILSQKKIGKQIHYEPLQVHGRICHCYDEIWWFLLSVDYIKINIKPIDFEFKGNFRQIKLDVYLKENALTDTFDLSKFNQRAYQDNYFNRDKSALVECEDDFKIDLQYFARLSLLLLFDLLNVQRSVPAMIKSDKYVKIFFNQMERIHSLILGSPQRIDLTFKDLPRIIIENLEYYKQSQKNQGFSNKLFSQKEIKNSYLFYRNNKYFTPDDELYYPKEYQVIIHQNFYFKKFMNNFFYEIQRFISNSSKQVQEQKLQNYKKYCFEVLFLKQHQNYQQLCNGFHSHQISIDKLSELRCKVDNIETLSMKTFQSLQAEKSCLYQDSNNPFVQVIIGGVEHKKQKEKLELQISQGSLQECQNNQQKLKDLEQQRREQLQKLLDFFSGKLQLPDELNEAEINAFLNTQDSEIFEHPEPKTMICQLKKHQKQALTWMLYREGFLKNTHNIEIKENNSWSLSPLWEEILLENNKKLYMNTFTGKITDEFQSYNSTKGGILADEMGLGKTIMTIGLLLQTQKRGRVTLIVVPKSVLLQWDQEIKMHTQPNSLNVLTFYKMSNRSKRINFNDYDVIITTYTVVAQNYTNWLRENGQEDPDYKPRSNSQKYQDQDFKNLQQEIQQYQENNLEIDLDSNDLNLQDQSDEFHSICEIKQPKNFKQNNNNQQDFYEIQNQEIQLKSKRSTNHHFNQQQKGQNLFDFNFYRVILDEAHNIKSKATLQTKGCMALKSECRWCLTGTPIQNKHDDLFSLLAFLKVETFGEYYWWNAYINKEENEEEQQYILGEIIRPIILRRTKQQLNQQITDKINEQICWVKLENKERILYDKFHEGTQQLFKVYLNQDKSRQFVHIFQIINKLRMTCDHPSIALKGLNLDFNSIDDIKQTIESFFARQKQGENEISEKQRQQLIDMIQKGNLTYCTLCQEDEIFIFGLSICGHIYCFRCFKYIIESQGECPTCQRRLTMKDILNVQSNGDDFQQIKGTEWGASSKIKAVVKETKKVQKKREKCLIFTQWIEMIKLLEEKLIEEEVWCSVITGAMSVEQRNKIIQQFEEHPAITALILSLRATSTGLNLTMANHVFLVDPWWNPAIEDQAIGRADRIGQKRQVNVIRFLCQNTIEEKINILHQKKKKMIKKVIANDYKKAQDIDDFKFLILEQ